MQEKYIEFNGKTYKVLNKLEGGLTNIVLLCKDNETAKEVVIKRCSSSDKKDSLQREIDFFGFIVNNQIEGFPQLLGISKYGKEIILEFKKGRNGKEIVDGLSSENWEKIGLQMGKVLKGLHYKKHDFNNGEKEVYIDQMCKYMKLQCINESDLVELKQMCSESSKKFCMLHGDFSPHNCLFIRDEGGEFSLGTTIDPSARISFGIPYFDIVYLLNSRWVRNKKNFRKGFISEYDFVEDDLYVKFDIIMKGYLKVIYEGMK